MALTKDEEMGGTASGPKAGDKVLSIRQPFADFIFTGYKWCENRTWRTKHRGPLWIHASRLEKREVEEWAEKGIDLFKESPFGMQTGAIIGRVDLIDCVEIYDLEGFPSGHTAPAVAHLATYLRRQVSWEDVSGPWCFLLDHAVPLKQPVVTHGALNVWTFPSLKSRQV